DLVRLARDRRHVGDVVVVLDGYGEVFDLGDHRLDRLLDADLQQHRVGARGDVAEAFVDHGLGQDRRRGGAVTGHVVRLGRDLAQELRAGVLHRVLELDLADDRHAVVGDGRRAELLLEHHVAALRAKRDAYRLGNRVDALLEVLSRLNVECDCFRHMRSPLLPCYFFLPFELTTARTSFSDTIRYSISSSLNSLPAYFA